MHLELAQRYLREGEAVVDEDPVQASEKVYKSAEEAIKSMAHSLGLAEVIDRVAKRGRWTVAELERVARRAKVTAYWDSANYLHVWGIPRGQAGQRSREGQVAGCEEAGRAGA